MASQAYLDLLAKAGRQPTDLGTQDRSLVQSAPKAAPSPVGFSPANLVHSAVSVGGAALGGIAHAAVDGFTGLYGGSRNNLQLRSQGQGLASQDKFISDRQTQLETAYKDGSISKDQYKQGYKELLATSNQNIQAHQKFTSDTQQKYYGAGEVATDYAKAAGTVLSVAAPFAEVGAGALAAVPGAEKVAGALDSTLAASKGNVVGKLVRNAVVTQPTVQQGTQVVGDLGNKKFASAAGSAAQFAALSAAPGIIEKYAPAVTGAIGDAVFGKPGLLNRVFGERLTQFIKDNPKTLPAFKQMQQFTLNQPGVDGNVKKGIQFLSNHFNEAIKQNPTEADLGLVVKNWKQYLKVASKAPEGLVASHDFTRVIPKALAVIDEMAPEDFKSVGNRLDSVTEIMDKLGIKNGTVVSNIQDALMGAKTKEEAAQTLKDIVQQQVVKKAGGGFIYTFAPKNVAALPGKTDLPKLLTGKNALPGFGAVGKAITKVGLSPAPVETSDVLGVVKQNFKDALTKSDVSLGDRANKIWKALAKETGQTKSVIDARLLNVNGGMLKGQQSIARALEGAGLNPSDAKLVRRALDSAYANTPASVQGLGSKLSSLAIKYAPGERQLLKAQSYGRFGINPFFAPKVITKSAYLATLEGNGGKVLGPVSEDIAKYVGNRPAGLAEDVLGVSGANKTSAGLVGKVQQNIAGNLVQNLLTKNGAKLEDLAKNPELKQQVDHAVQMIYGYPKGGFLSSNLAKSLNVAVFPARFEAKVLGATARAIATQPPVARAAILNGLIKANSFINSSEGKQWKKDNSELWDVTKYFTPLDTVSKVMSAITGKGDIGLKDLGSIGGLPFGVITQALSDQGVNLGPIGSSPYTPTKTGVSIGKQVPQNLKARAATALGSIINQMFSYPGAQIGLPSKASLTKSLVGFGSGGTLTTNKGDFKTVGGSQQTSAKSTGTIPTIKSYKAPATKLPSIQTFVKPAKAKRPKTLAKRIGQPF